MGKLRQGNTEKIARKNPEKIREKAKKFSISIDVLGGLCYYNGVERYEYILRNEVIFMFVKVREVNDDLDSAMDTLQSNGASDLDLGHFNMTYKTTDANVKPGDLVLINVNHQRAKWSENTLGLVEKVEEEHETDYAVKDVLGVVKYGRGLLEKQREARKAELMQEMKSRAEKINQISLMKKLAENDDKMAQLVKLYEEL